MPLLSRSASRSKALEKTSQHLKSRQSFNEVLIIPFMHRQAPSDRPNELKPGKYKTELCKNYSERGFCPYRGKCRFAHGTDDLVAQSENTPNTKFRTKKCRSYWSQGFCKYGSRCQFEHVAGVSSETRRYLKIWKLVLQAAENVPRPTPSFQN